MAQHFKYFMHIFICGTKQTIAACWRHWRSGVFRCAAYVFLCVRVCACVYFEAFWLPGSSRRNVAAVACSCLFCLVSCAALALACPFAGLSRVVVDLVARLSRSALKSRIFQVIYVGETVATNISGRVCPLILVAIFFCSCCCCCLLLMFGLLFFLSAVHEMRFLAFVRARCPFCGR